MTTVTVKANQSLLFDGDGLPYSSRLPWGWLLLWISGLLLMLAPLDGIYLGLWLRTKGRSSWVLGIYLTLTCVCIAVFFPENENLLGVETIAILILWLAGAVMLRHEVTAYYYSRESLPFCLNPALTALFGPWYVGGNLRANFPLDDTGKVGSGVLRLVD